MAMALTSSFSWKSEYIWVMLAYNFAFMCFVIVYQWSKSAKLFNQVYQLDSHITDLNHQTAFAGIVLNYGKRSQRSLEDFELNAIKFTSKLKVLLTVLGTVGAYILILYFLSGKNILLVYQSLFAASYIGLFLSFSYWGLYIFGLFFGLLFFGINCEIIYPFGYIVVLIFSALFIINLHLLNNWYWFALNGQKSRIFSKKIKYLFVPILIFTFGFLVTDHFIEEEKSFMSQLAKIPSQKSQKISTEFKIAKNISQHISGRMPTLGMNSEQAQNIADELLEISKQMESLENLPNPSTRDLEEYTDLLDQKNDLVNQLNSIKSSESLAKTSTKSEISLPSSISSMPQEGMAQIFQHKNFKTSVEKNFPKLSQEISFKEDLKELDRLEQKVKSENSFSAMEEYQKQKEKILDSARNHQDNHQKFVEQMQKDIREVSDPIEQKKLNEKLEKMGEVSDNQTYQQQKREFNRELQEINSPIKDQASTDNTKEQIDYIKTKVEDLKSENSGLEKYASHIKFIVLCFLVFFILYLIHNLMSKDRLKEFKEELSPEQKKKALDIIKRIPRHFKSFSDEVDCKYKIFHELAETVFYFDENKAPPAMILARSQKITHDEKLRKFAKNLGLIFNAVHFGKEESFTSREQNIFRKSFEAAIQRIKKHLQ